ncbi:13644_t:CDS:1, partial [Gigaspora rosea]
MFDHKNLDNQVHSFTAEIRIIVSQPVCRTMFLTTASSSKNGIFRTIPKYGFYYWVNQLIHYSSSKNKKFLQR